MPCHWTMFLILVLAASCLRADSILYVDGDATAAPHDGSDWCHAYRELHEALAVTQPGTTIRVANGTYAPNPAGLLTAKWATFRLLSGVRIEGGYAGCGAPNPHERNLLWYPTTLTCDLAGNDDPAGFPTGSTYGDNCFHVITASDVDRTAVLEGFTITGGDIGGSPPSAAGGTRGGGGIFCNRGSPTIHNCVITRNRGGGVYCYRGSAALFTECTITENAFDSDYDEGRGISCWLSDATIRDCTIAANAKGGVGAYGSSVVIERCSITDHFVYYNGAAISLGGEANPVIKNCSLLRNSTNDRGGAVFSTSTNATILNTLMAGNSASEGGAVWGAETLVSIINCTITGNAAPGGGGVAAWADGLIRVLNSTIVGNTASQGGGIYVSADGKIAVENSIVWGNSNRQLYTSQESKISVRYSDVQGGPAAVTGGGQLDWGEGAINADPLLVGTQNAFRHLSLNSPCVNSGYPNGSATTPSVDLDGEPRVFDGRIDMGADEYNDCNGNFMADYLEIAAAQAMDCSGNNILDECEVDCNTNGFVDTCDVYTGRSSDCTANLIPDECEPDCNENGEADSIDECDAASGTVQDCDGNRIPDVCESVSDCNANAVLDACERLANPAIDEDQDGIIDACETAITLYVDDEGPQDPGPGDSVLSDPAEDGTQAHPYDGIQEAIDAAREIESAHPAESCLVEIIVRPGTYKGPSNRNLTFHRRPYLLRGEKGAAYSIIDGERLGRVFQFNSGEPPGARLDGVTIQHGAANYGGGIACENGSNPTIRNCIISDNTADILGGGIYSERSSPTLIGCVIERNSAAYDGGGAHFTSFSHPFIRNCIIRGNYASTWGGGLNFRDFCRPIVADCLITGNVCDHVGGGIHYDDCHPIITRCIVTNNTAENVAGGIACHLSHHSVISDCLVAGNVALKYRAGGVTSSGCSDLLIRNCTIVQNTAPESAGLSVWGGYQKVENTILWGNTPSEIEAESGPELSIECTNLQGGRSSIVGNGIVLWGEGNGSGNPQFVDADGVDGDAATVADNDYRLSAFSPCLDAGTQDSIAADFADLYRDGEPALIDLDGHARVLCRTIDVGAYESGLGDSECDGDTDLRDFAALSNCMQIVPESPYPPACEVFDSELDGDVDLADALSLALDGPQR